LRLWRTQDIQSIFRTNFIKTRTWKNTIRTIFKSARTKFENQKDDCRNTNSTEKRHCETELSLFWTRGFLRLCFELHLLVTFQDFQNMWKTLKMVDDKRRLYLFSVSTKLEQKCYYNIFLINPYRYFYSFSMCTLKIKVIKDWSFFLPLKNSMLFFQLNSLFI